MEDSGLVPVSGTNGKGMTHRGGPPGEGQDSEARGKQELGPGGV